MPGRQLRAVTDDPQTEAAAWLHQADDKLLACRGQGHAWPKVRRDKVPRGIRAIPQHDGSYQVTFTCRDCGMDRTLTTLPGGQLDLPAQYTYRAPPGYKSPKGSRINRRMAFAETWRRALEQAALTSAGPSPSGVPEINFRSS